jgi:membrane protease subunit (stomatin/prohibitin family)
MGFFSKLRSDGDTFDGQGDERRGLVDVIQYNGAIDDLVWKFPYNNLSTGAQLIVNKSQEAIFVKGGAVCDVLGEGTHTLSANNLPLLEKIVNLPFGGRTPFTAEVWYVNKVIRRGLKFGTPQPIRVSDPRYSGVDIPVRAHGDYSIRVKDSQMLLNEFVGTQHLFTTGEFVKQFGTMVVQELNMNLKRYARQQNISTLDFPEFAPEIANFIKETLINKFELYGIELIDFQFAHVGPNEDDQVVKDLINNRLESLKERERRSIQGFDYQTERKFDVLETAAGNEGNAGNMMGAGMGLGMGVGVGGMFGGQMQQVAQTMVNPQPVQTPPPLIMTPYYVYLNGSQQGPFDANTLKSLADTHVLTPDTLVWKQGMAQWGKAIDQPDLQPFFAAGPPPPPVPPVMP